MIGDIRKYLVPANGKFQIRLRGREENAQVWRHHYTATDTPGDLPKAVAERGRADVGQLATPPIQSACVNKCFVIHRDHLDIMRGWKSQIAKVIPARDAGPVDKTDPAYFMTDESIITFLLAFSRAALPIIDPQFNKNPMAHVAHFRSNPKPWKRWRKQTWYCRRHVPETIAWILKNGNATPPLPANFPPLALPAQLPGAPRAGNECQSQVLGGYVILKTGMSLNRRPQSAQRERVANTDQILRVVNRLRRLFPRKCLAS